MMVLSIVLAVVFSNILGALWYSPVLFVKPWLRSQGLPEDLKPSEAQKKEGMRSMMYNVVTTIITMLVLGHMLAMGYQYFPSFRENAIGASALLGVLVWLGYVVPTTLQAVFFERKNWKTAGINLAYRIIELVGASLLITTIGLK